MPNVYEKAHTFSQLGMVGSTVQRGGTIRLLGKSVHPSFSCWRSVSLVCCEACCMEHAQRKMAGALAPRKRQSHCGKRFEGFAQKLRAACFFFHHRILECLSDRWVELAAARSVGGSIYEVVTR